MNKIEEADYADLSREQLIERLLSVATPPRYNSATLHHFALQALPAHIAVLDRQGQVIAVNRSWTSFAARNEAADNPSVGIGSNYFEVCRKAIAADNADAAKALTGIEAVLRGDTVQFSMEYPCDSPCEQRWFVMSVDTLRLNDEDGLVIAHFDISARKRSDEDLRISEARSSGILRAAPVGIGVLIDRVFLEVNATMTTMTGYAQEELIGQSARMLYPTQADFDYVGAEKYRQIRARGVGTVLSRWRRKDGSIIDVSLSSTAIESGDLSRGVVFSAVDITERRIAEERQRDTLVREVHHRIKNHLQGVLGLMRSAIVENPAIALPMEDIITRVRAIVDAYGLQSSRQDARVRLSDLLRTAAEDVGAALMLEVSPLGEAVVIMPDEAVPMALVVNELLTNAVKHVALPDSVRRVRVTLEAEGAVARTEFRSSPAWLPDGFDFAQRRGIGTGLELVAALLPLKGATLCFRQESDEVVAELVLAAPVIDSENSEVRPGV